MVKQMLNLIDPQEADPEKFITVPMGGRSPLERRCQLGQRRNQAVINSARRKLWTPDGPSEQYQDREKRGQLTSGCDPLGRTNDPGWGVLLSRGGSQSSPQLGASTAKGRRPPSSKGLTQVEEGTSCCHQSTPVVSHRVGKVRSSPCRAAASPLLTFLDGSSGDSSPLTLQQGFLARTGSTPPSHLHLQLF